MGCRWKTNKGISMGFSPISNDERFIQALTLPWKNERSGQLLFSVKWFRCKTRWELAVSNRKRVPWSLSLFCIKRLIAGWVPWSKTIFHQRGLLVGFSENYCSTIETWWANWVKSKMHEKIIIEIAPWDWVEFQTSKFQSIYVTSVFTGLL